MSHFKISIRKKWAYHIFRNDIDTGYWYLTLEEAEKKAMEYSMWNGDNYLGFISDDD